MDRNKITGKRILLIRVENDMSQKGLATKLNLHPATLINIEKGRKFPTIETLYKLCEIFNKKIGDFLPEI